VAEESRKATIVARVSVALMAMVVLVFVIDLLEGPFFSLSTRMWTPERRGDRLIGGIEGAVKGTDVSTSTVRVASGFLGLASLPVVITPQTQIAIKGKLGGFADLGRGQFVRVAYEVLPDRLVAWRVDVLDRVTSETVGPAQTTGEPAVSETPPRAETSSSMASPSTLAPGPTSSVKAPSPPSVSRWRAAPPVPSPPSAWAPPTRQNASSAPSWKRAVVALSSSPRTQVQDAPRSAPAPTSRPVTPGARQAEDGGEAMDWLLKESGTRGQ
jgi:hypothetical protein